VARVIKNRDQRAVRTRRADHATPFYQQQCALLFADQRRSSVGIVRLRAKRHIGMCVPGPRYEARLCARVGRYTISSGAKQATIITSG
jgi:hypothetical protein